MTSSRRLARLTLAAVIAASAPGLVGAPIGGAGWSAPECVNAAAQNHAAIVVEHSNGTMLATCVGFDATQLTGKQLLVASGIEYGVSTDPSYGDELCQVDNEPQTYPSPCLTPSMPYWALTHANYGGSWMVANKGIDGLMFVDGDTMGLRYMSSSSQPGPPERTPAGICPPPQPKPTPSSVAPPATAPPASNSSVPGHSAVASPPPVIAPSTNSASPSPTDMPTASEPRATSVAHPTTGRGGGASRGPDPRGTVAFAAAVLALLGMLVVQVLAGRRGT